MWKCNNCGKIHENKRFPCPCGCKDWTKVEVEKLEKEICDDCEASLLRDDNAQLKEEMKEMEKEIANLKKGMGDALAIIPCILDLLDDIAGEENTHEDYDLLERVFKNVERIRDKLQKGKEDKNDGF
ncbi:MAG: hypothetical protein BV459_03900 [Thermoplasmata archaeon M11B2D]|nr:MAG: hypothetical protein BV459_03900 [Thermoplasmata archaeon M11B2D]